MNLRGRLVLRGALATAGWFFTAAAASASVTPQERSVFDPVRNRNIPILVYATSQRSAKPLVIISHGKGIKNAEYGFIASSIAERGYVVASIQHDLPGDPPVPNTGNIPRDRTPGWRAQVNSILLVAKALSRDASYTFRGAPILIGHSNGGDASMMAARDYPSRFSIVMSLDNRRFALPRTSRPRICTLRSSDQKPDPGVMPMSNELNEFSIRVTFAANLRHDDMWDGATPEQKSQILDAIWGCLNP